MKTRTDIHAGASQPQADLSNLAACKAEKQYWMNQAQHMENVLANCRPRPQPMPGPINPPSGGGYIGGVYYPDRSGLCG